MDTNSWLYFLDDYRDDKASMAMKNYLRNQFEFLGIPAKLRRTLLQNKISSSPGLNLAETELLVWEMWASPFREYHYCAIELLEKRKNGLNLHHAELLEYLIVTHSWWDTVDLIASHLVGLLLSRNPELVEPINRKWMESGNLWLQRSCLLFQLMYKENTNTRILEKNIKALKDEKDFFIRKAIGWILRQYSKTDPEWVKRILSRYELSYLSRKEAMKWIERHPS